jgi:ribosome-associated protein
MDDHPQQEQPSRSAKKRAAKAVEELAERLMNLADADFRRLPLAGEIRREIEEARRIKAHSARKRQLKHLAGLLRRDDESRQEAEGFLALLDLGRHQDAERFHQLEELRERLCDPESREAALAETERNFPGMDLARVRRLAEAAQGGTDKRAFRELFRLLRAAKPEAE